MRRSAEAAQRVHWHVDEPLGFGGWWIDPGCFRFGRRCRGPIDEALRVLAKGLIESVLASAVDGVGLAVMNLVWGHQADPEVVMVLIVPNNSARSLGHPRCSRSARGIAAGISSS